ncbi:hypothetical protein HPGCJGGD_3356 [Methylobacterium haplocladii]|nr:hypothetical protein HPGCJGGD_3356 [Methylobacterium haplocladii]
MTFREAEAKIETLHGRLEAMPSRPNRFVVLRSLAATTTERRALCAVQNRLEQDLAPWTDRGAVEVIVTRLNLNFEIGRVSEIDARIRDNEFVEAVKGLPLAGIEAAARRFGAKTTLTAWDPKWRPNSAQFADEVRAGLIPLRTKLLHIRRVLEAEVYDPPTEADQARVAAEMARFARERAAFAEDADRARPTPTHIAEVREATFRAGVADLKRFDGHFALGDLMGRLDAKSGRGSAQAGRALPGAAASPRPAAGRERLFADARAAADLGAAALQAFRDDLSKDENTALATIFDDLIARVEAAAQRYVPPGDHASGARA